MGYLLDLPEDYRTEMADDYLLNNLPSTQMFLPDIFSLIGHHIHLRGAALVFSTSYPLHTCKYLFLIVHIRRLANRSSIPRRGLTGLAYALALVPWTPMDPSSLTITITLKNVRHSFASHPGCDAHWMQSDRLNCSTQRPSAYFKDTNRLRIASPGACLSFANRRATRQ